MDVFTMISSYMTAGVLTAQYILRNITLLTFMIPVGITTSSQIMVGNNIGADRVPVAKVYALMCFKTAVIWALCTISILLFFRGLIMGVFTSDQAVIDIITGVYPLILTFVLFDCVQCVGQGIIRGLGKQGKASIGTVIGYWVIGIPLALLGVFWLKWGMAGLWLGPVVAIIFNFGFYFSLVIRTDWQEIANQSKARRQKER
jgi:multidrug resistance protein, MATE family